MVYYAGVQQDASHPGPEQQVIFDGNRVLDHVNYGTNFLGFVGSLLPPTFASLGLTAAPGVNHVVVTNNDYARNGDARTLFNGVFYPQPIQYSGLLFNTAGSDASDPLQPSQIDATIGFNTFVQNGYGIGVNQRVAVALSQASHSVEMHLIENRYCGNAFNSVIANFGLNSQSHGTTMAGQTFRYAQGSSYRMDATRDVALTEDALDWDHPVTDPRLPASGLLGNTLLFNGSPIPNGVRLSRPPVVSEGPPTVYGALVTVPDTTPPQIMSSLATPSTLWPPDGMMRPVRVDARGEDVCDPSPVCRIIGVTSDQLPRPGPDWIFTAPLALELRAERLGQGQQGRTYTVTVGCTDAAGNVSTTDVSVRVPHDRGR
jgi:hypothetical protein